MRKRITALYVFFLMSFVITVGTAQAFNYVFSPSDPDLADLDHSYYYKWGIQWVIPNGEIITGAEIKFYDIYNWAGEANDRLYINLLNTVNDTNGTNSPNYVLVNETGYSYRTYTKTGVDNQSNGNAFSGLNAYNIVPSPGYWTDPDDNTSSTPLISYSIPSDHYGWISDGNFGFGLDPDCHYYNSRIEFEITTAAVPEPSTMLLLGSGLLGLVGYGRKRLLKKEIE